MALIVRLLEPGSYPQEKEVGRFVLEGGKICIEPEDDPLLREILAETIGGPVDGKMRAVTSKGNPAAFMEGLRYQYKSAYLWATKPEETEEKRGTKSLLTPSVKESYFSTCERDKEGHCLPKGEGGKASSPKEGNGKPAADRIGKVKCILADLGRKGIDGVAKLCGTIGHAKHVAMDWIAHGCEKNVARLPLSVQPYVRGAWAAAKLGWKGYFVSYTAAQILVEKCAQRHGATPEEAAKMRGCFASIDFLAYKPVMIGFEVATGPLAAMGVSFIPVGSAMYLAYSTAKDAVAIGKKAADLAGRAAAKLGQKVRGKGLGRIDPDELADRIYLFIRNDDWKMALFLHALEVVGDAERALHVAEAAYREGGSESRFGSKSLEVLSKSVQFTEEEHPRDKGGKFAEKPESPTVKPGRMKEEKKPKKTATEWDGTIDQTKVDPDRGYGSHGERITTWNFYGDEGELYEQSVYVAHGTYDPDPDDPDSEPVDVYRWESRDDYAGVTERGEWTADEAEATRDGEHYAYDNDQKEPDTEDENEEEEEESDTDESEDADDEEDTEDAGEEPMKEDEAKEIFGSLDDDFIVSIVGIPEGGKVKKSAVKKWVANFSDDVDMEAYGVEVEIEYPSLKSCRRFIGVDTAGKKFIKNDLLEIKSKFQGKGLGSSIFANEVESAVRKGFAYIQTHAAGDSKGPMNGYYTWPLLGYNESLASIKKYDPKLAKRIQAEFPDAESILDIFDAGGGDWWKENGSDLRDARFDLSVGSRSRKVLAAYLDERKKRGR